MCVYASTAGGYTAVTKGLNMIRFDLIWKTRKPHRQYACRLHSRNCKSTKPRWMQSIFKSNII